MSATTDHAETNLPDRYCFQPGQVVMEIGHDSDASQELREAIEKATVTELVDEEHDGPADAVILWFREDDGDLTDALVDAGRIRDRADCLPGGPAPTRRRPHAVAPRLSAEGLSRR
ncbi:DUF3052 family protein [Streptomyces sp. SID5910]|nr:DUF3052 family protein [Streptomyces sp. SID5910]